MKTANILSNPDLFSRLVELELKRCLRYQSFISILLVEAYLIGSESQENAALSPERLSQLIGAQVRETDLIGVYDENVLSIVLLHSDTSMAHCVAQRLGIFMSHYFGTPANPEKFCIGVACFPSNATDLLSLYQSATNMLAETKSLGRREVCA